MNASQYDLIARQLPFNVGQVQTTDIAEGRTIGGENDQDTEASKRRQR
jgi:hypothetical protein